MIIQQKIKSLKEFTVDSISYFSCQLGTEIEIPHIDEEELNFDKHFLHFNLKKKIYAKATFNLSQNIEYTALAETVIDSYNDANSYLDIIIFKWEEENFRRCKKVHPVRYTSSTFTRLKLCKRPEVNKSSHWWYSISSVGGMLLPVFWPDPAFIRQLAQNQGLWFSWDFQKFKLFSNNCWLF